MKWKEKLSIMECWPYVLYVIVLLVMRAEALAVNPLANFIALALLTALVAIAMRSRSFSVALFFAVMGPLAAWLLDVVDGPMAFVNGAVTLSMAILYALMWAHPPVVRAAGGAVAGMIVGVLGVALIIAVTRERSPGAAFTYAFTRDAKNVIAYFVGGLVYLIWR